MKLVVAGAGGRMGRMLMNVVAAHPGCVLYGAVDREGSSCIGDVAHGLTISDDICAAMKGADGLLDFTTPEASLKFAQGCASFGQVHIIGTTGFTPAQEGELRANAKGARTVKAGNFSVGVNVLLGLTKRAAEMLGAQYDIEITEMHHRHKVDAPSGTALMLGEAAATGRGVKLDEVAVKGRGGITGARKPNEIGFNSIRGGEVIGEHSVIFAGGSERLEFTHKAQDRTLFAGGAVQAALWARDQAPGFYAMTDVLGL